MDLCPICRNGLHKDDDAKHSKCVEELCRQLALVAHERDFLHKESALLEGQRNEARRKAEDAYDRLSSIEKLRVGGLPWRPTTLP